MRKHMYNFEEIKKALEPYTGRIGGGVFSCIGNDSPDQFEAIYNKDGVLIIHNTYYDYMDIVGLSKEHFEEVADTLSIDWEAIYAEQKKDMEEYELLSAAEPVNRTISIMTSYFSGDINENELVDLLMTITNNNKYVKEHILNVITDKE